MPGGGETLLLPARTPTIMMICAHWPCTVWTSHHPLDQSGSWVPPSSASSTRSLIGVTIASALPWPAEALCCPGLAWPRTRALSGTTPQPLPAPSLRGWSSSWTRALPPALALPFFEDHRIKTSCSQPHCTWVLKDLKQGSTVCDLVQTGT